MDTECFLVYDNYEFMSRPLKVLACFRDSDRKLIFIRFFDDLKSSAVGNVYAARVEKKVDHVGVFLVIPYGHVFVREKDLKNPFYIKRQSTKKELSPGDMVLVQIEKDAIKTKEPEGKFLISIKTPYFILESTGEGVRFSKKISKENKERLSSISAYGKSLLLRTASVELDLTDLDSKIKEAAEIIDMIYSDGKNHTAPSLVWSDDDLLNRLLSSFPFARNHLKVTKIKTSDSDICKKLAGYGKLYRDEGLPLLDLYRIRTITDGLLKKTVWLKSGGNIVIEQTEALTVIDVNSAKTKKSLPFDVNKEAAETIMEQIKLRNLSGIIVIDFMKMRDEDDRRAVISLMKSYGEHDFARITVEGFTHLGLLEMTREKLFPSVAQTLTGHLNYDNITHVDAQQGR